MDQSILLQRFMASDEKALQEIYMSYFSKLYYFSNEYLNDKFQAENIVNDAFVILWNKRKSLCANTNIGGYLYTIVRNKCINYIERQSNRNKNLNSLSDEKIVAEYNIYALKQLELSSLDLDYLQKKVEDILESLPEKTKEIFSLSRFQEMKNREISEELDIPIKTVEYHMSKALKEFKTQLGGYYALLPLIVNHVINQN